MDMLEKERKTSGSLGTCIINHHITQASNKGQFVTAHKSVSLWVSLKPNSVLLTHRFDLSTETGRANGSHISYYWIFSPHVYQDQQERASPDTKVLFNLVLLVF